MYSIDNRTVCLQWIFAPKVSPRRGYRATRLQALLRGASDCKTPANSMQAPDHIEPRRRHPSTGEGIAIRCQCISLVFRAGEKSLAGSNSVSRCELSVLRAEISPWKPERSWWWLDILTLFLGLC